MKRLVAFAITSMALTSCVDKPARIATEPSAEESAAVSRSGASEAAIITSSTVCRQSRRQLEKLTGALVAETEQGEIADLEERIGSLETVIADVCN